MDKLDDYHQPVLLNESIEGLSIQPNGIFVDVTFGGGGHSRAILKQLKNGKLIAFDQDTDAQKNIINDKRFVFVNHNFRFLHNFLRYHKAPQVDGILADLGVSSHHFDTASRGFTFRANSELDMRMNTQATLSAKTVVNQYTEEQLTHIFREYGELRNARKLASLIVKSRHTDTIGTTGKLQEIISATTAPTKQNQLLARVFQALRIEVNQEIECLKTFLQQSAQCLKPGGRLVVISYHSLEDRLVKNFIRWGNFSREPEKDVYGNYHVPFKAITRNVITPTNEEIIKNNRARSAKLRIAEKV